jgi:hypothetical protein
LRHTSRRKQRHPSAAQHAQCQTAACSQTRCIITTHADMQPSCLSSARTPCSSWLPAATCRISTGTSQHYARSQAGPALLRAARIYSWFPPAIYRAPGSSLRCHDGLFKSIGRLLAIEVNRNLANTAGAG